MQYDDYKDPRAILRDEIDTYAEGVRYIQTLGIPWTPDLVEKLAVSAHIQADRNGYRGPAPQPPPNTENVQHSERTGPQREERDYDGPDNGPESDHEPPRDYRGMTQVASEKSMGMLKGVLAKAYDIHAKAEQVNIRDAETAVKIAVRDAYEKEWGVSPNLAQPKGRLHQGQVSWTIAYILEHWEGA